MAAAVSSEKPDPKRRKVCPSREGDGKHARLLSWLKRYGCQLAPWLEIGEAEGQGEEGMGRERGKLGVGKRRKGDGSRGEGGGRAYGTGSKKIALR